MNINDLIGVLSAVSKIDSTSTKNNLQEHTQYDLFIDRFVLVRHHMLGVNVGYLKKPTKEGFYLQGGRKFWKWQAENGIALESFAKRIRIEGTRATEIAELVFVPTDNLCGIITVDDDANIKAMLDCPVSHQD